MDENVLRIIMMKIENEDDLESWCSISTIHSNTCKKFKKEWYGKYKPVTDIDENGDKRETITIGNREYVTTFFENGKEKHKEGYKDGKEEGKWIGWWDDGKTQFEVEYKNGRRDGKWIAWWKNGKKSYKGEYKNGKPDGEWILWYENGNRMNEEEFKNGKKCGIWKSWDVDGILKSWENHGPCGEKIESISPRKKSKKTISQKKCAVKGKMQNTVTGGCRRKCKIGKEKIGSDGKCTKR